MECRPLRQKVTGTAGPADSIGGAYQAAGDRRGRPALWGRTVKEGRRLA